MGCGGTKFTVVTPPPAAPYPIQQSTQPPQTVQQAGNGAANWTQPQMPPSYQQTQNIPQHGHPQAHTQAPYHQPPPPAYPAHTPQSGTTQVQQLPQPTPTPVPSPTPKESQGTSTSYPTLPEEPLSADLSPSVKPHVAFSSAQQTTQETPAEAVPSSMNYASVIQESDANNDSTHNQTSNKSPLGESQKPRRGRRGRKTRRGSRKSPTRDRAYEDLRGVQQEQAACLYVRNINLPLGYEEADIINYVKRYAGDRGLRVMKGNVVRNRYCDDVVGCRINVPSSQVEEALSPNFWPDGITCCRWKRRKPTKDQRWNTGQDYGQWTQPIYHEEHYCSQIWFGHQMRYPSW